MLHVIGSRRYNRPFDAAKRSPSCNVTLTKSAPLRSVLHRMSPLSRSMATTVPLMPAKIVLDGELMESSQAYRAGLTRDEWTLSFRADPLAESTPNALRRNL